MNVVEVFVFDVSVVVFVCCEVVVLVICFGFDEVCCGQLVLVVIELVINFVKYGGGGCLLLVVCVGGIELLVFDQGLGMFDVVVCLVDGYFIIGIVGNGLGVVCCLFVCLDVVSWFWLGSVVYVCVGLGVDLVVDVIVVVVVVKLGEIVCGDGWVLYEDEVGCMLMVVDGLGYGIEVVVVVCEVVVLFMCVFDCELVVVVQVLYLGLCYICGGVVVVVCVQWDVCIIGFVGFGNIVGVFVGLGGDMCCMVLYNGIVGYNVCKIQIFEYFFGMCVFLVMYLDGVGGYWLFDCYLGLLLFYLVLVVGLFYCDYVCGWDDVVIVVLWLEWL